MEYFASAADILLRQIDGLGFQFNSNVFAGHPVEFHHDVAFGDASLKPDTADFDRGTHYRMLIVMTDAEASALEDS